MLILRRRVGEVIVIGEGSDAIEIKVVDVKTMGVGIGVSAPAWIPVNRKEVADAIENRAAAIVTPGAGKGEP